MTSLSLLDRATSLPLEITISKKELHLSAKRNTILIANDDENVCYLIEEALQEIELAIDSHFVRDGQELLDYLHRRDRYADISNSLLPDLIVLDLNMPRLTGQEALAEIKSDPNLRQIPIVVMTTSQREEDIFNCYNLGANSFLVKPLTFYGLVRAMKSLCHYWFEIGSPSVEND